jgi:uncharacterized protein (TIGR00251 family)
LNAADGDPGCARWDGDDLIVDVRVQPRASHNQVGAVEHGRLKIYTTAAPADGKANTAVQRLLAAYLGVARSQVVLQSGASARNKRFAVRAPSAIPAALCIAAPRTNGL